MTKDLQHAMARYEEARARYRRAVLASLDGDSSGESIREAIQAFQIARADLARNGGCPPPARTARPHREEPRAWGFGFVRRLLQAS